MVAVALVLLAVLRRPSRALVPLVPIALATGWSALIVFLLGIPLNPMSASLGTLVIAISTEFSVLLSERFRQERAFSPTLAAALRRTYRSTGVAVLASGITAIAGFGVLMVSDITMLSDFGLVTVIDLAVSLCGVLVVLPAALAAAERGSFERAANDVVRFLGARTARLRRRPSVV
jgi:predicted RND superfamily exporter protein